MSGAGTRCAVLLTCEHATARVPAPWRRLLSRTLTPEGWAAFELALASHRGVDFGALSLARTLARRSGWPLTRATHSRLLVDCNRTIGHPALFSPFTRLLPPARRAALLAEVYVPHVGAVADTIAAAVARGVQVRHLALHSFTPALRGQVRPLDLGVLYDPARGPERALADALVAALKAALPELRVRRNAPYRGTADGLPTALRRKFAADAYLGFELECNQALVLGQGSRWVRLRTRMARVLHDVMAQKLLTRSVKQCHNAP